MPTNHLQAEIEANVRKALAEDLGDGDLTADLIAESKTARAIIRTRQPMTMAGQPWVDEVYRQLDPAVTLEWLVNDGDHVLSDVELCIINGPARAVLTGERTALNFLQTLSATATVTARYATELSGSKTRILDTRKTLPGLRAAQKYAVRCGGGINHRMGLYDAILVKENHILSAGGIAAAIRTAREQHPELPIEVEVESILEMQEALTAGADRILLDNFDIFDLQRAVEINVVDGKPPAELEASGGFTLTDLRAVAETGVDYISIGGLTKNVEAIDLSMRFRFTD